MNASFRGKRFAMVAVLLLALSAAGFFGARYWAVQTLRSHVLHALGPDGEVGEIVVGWSSIELHALRVKAPPGKRTWPAEDQLRARKVVVVPSVKDLLTAKVRVRAVHVEGAYLSVLRTREGRLRLLPGLLERQNAAVGSAVPPVTIDEVTLDAASVDVFDASVRQPAHRVRLDQLQARVLDIRVPDLGGRTTLELKGVVRGVQRDGTLELRGWIALADKNSDLKTTLRGVDLVALQPYLIKASETGVRRGTLDLDVHSTVRANRLHAPGTVTLSGLELAASGPFGTFMGMPRQAVLAALKDKRGRITIRFTLQGDLSDPRFSLNESFALRSAAAMAEFLGVSVESVTRGVGNAAQGVGEALRKVFGR